MGYRSEVRALIYGDPAKIDALCMKWRHTETIDLWHVDAFGAHITEWTDAEGVRFIELHGENWKWYEGYADVGAWTRFQAMAEEMGLCSEFIRIGEDASDIEVSQNGEECEYHLGVSSSTYSSVEPPEPETTS